jgi:hypothetical protein
MVSEQETAVGQPQPGEGDPFEKKGTRDRYGVSDAVRSDGSSRWRAETLISPGRELGGPYGDGERVRNLRPSTQGRSPRPASTR